VSSIEERLASVQEKFGVTLHEHQTKTLTALAAGKSVILHSPTGCHAKGQGVLMYDGYIKRIEDVRVGDKLMGPDSDSRVVTQLIRGNGRMYEITPVKGKSFIVNEDHIISLVRTNTSSSTRSRKSLERRLIRDGKVVDVSVRNWLSWSKTQKHVHKLFRVGVNFSTNSRLPLDAYLLGAYLGDGSSAGNGTPSITKVDVEKELVTAASMDLCAGETRRTGSSTYSLSGQEPSRGRAGGSNSLINTLRELGLYELDCGQKFVPQVYKTAGRNERLALLAGLMDTDGSVDHCGLDFVTKSNLLAEDVAFVARSVGLAAYISPCRKSDQYGTVGDYFRICLSGDTAVIPCRIGRKQSSKRMITKNVLRTGFSISYAGTDDYYGFTLTGDGRYLLDDFTVTHNSGKTLSFQAAPMVLPHSGITVILYPLRALVKDQTRRFQELGLDSATLYGETKTKDRAAILERITAGDAKLLLTTPESFDRNRRLQDALKRRGVNLLVVDEAHAYEEWADGFRPTYRRAGYIAEKVGAKQFLLCSATLTAKGYKTAAETLKQTSWTVVQVPPVRSNLIYKDLSEPAEEILIRAVRGKGLPAPGIVFFTTIKKLNEVADEVDEGAGTKVLRYHGGMAAKPRRVAQEAFMAGNEWIFATKAFGMGIDKANIRNIIHYQLPSSILSYAQEAGRGGRNGAECLCFLTKSEFGEAAQFLMEMSVPSLSLVRRVWQVLQEIALDTPSPWFEVDWDAVSSQTRLYPQAIQACVSWLFTGKMIERKNKRASWKIILDEETDAKAALYKKSAPEIVEALKAEAMFDEVSGVIELKPEELEECVGPFVSNWRLKLRTLADRGVFKLDEPPAGRATYRFLHNEFHFAEGAEQLKQARNSAFSRLDGMRRLQRLAPDRRREAIEAAISLDVSSLNISNEPEPTVDTGPTEEPEILY
jgi:superfamily II DNA/RNA helicase